MSVLELAYKNLTFQGKVEGRSLVSFGANKPAYDTLSKANQGDTFTIEVVKNDAGYNDWVSATAGTINNSAATPATNPGRSGVGASATPAPRSNYETPEERAQRQVFIIRQSSISSAISTLTAGAKTSPKVEDVLNVAKQYEDFVFGKGNDTDILVDSPNNLDDDIPF